MTLIIFFLVLSSVFHSSLTVTASTSSKSKEAKKAAASTLTGPASKVSTGSVLKDSAATDSSLSMTSFSSSESTVDRRAIFAFSDEDRWDCFYRSTLPVEGLNKEIWRVDEYGNLLMAGLSYCPGVLCYNFDHRYPLSKINDEMTGMEPIINLMKSVDNCQAMSVRVNSLKGSSAEEQIQNIVPKFGFDGPTKQLFTANNFHYAKHVQNKLIDSGRFAYIKSRYDAYEAKNSSSGTEVIPAIGRFDVLRNKAAQIVASIEAILATL